MTVALNRFFQVIGVAEREVGEPPRSCMATLQESLVLGYCFICTLIGLPIIVFESFL